MGVIHPFAPNTSEQILDIAQFLVQTKGFNGFSYADVASQLGIRNAAVHYHFRSKTDLGKALVVRYRQTFTRALATIDAEVEPAPAKLERYVLLFQAALENGLRMCLCGMLASELTTLPEGIQLEVRAFFADQQSWLARVLREGQAAQTLVFTGDAQGKADELLASLEGAMLLARMWGSVASFRGLAQGYVAALGVPLPKHQA
jgi:TetR/AcrR family transcriptional regulator, transcriptional repressor for nem operon